MMKAFLFTFGMAAILTCHQASAQLLEYNFNSDFSPTGGSLQLNATDVTHVGNGGISLVNNRMRLEQAQNDTIDVNSYATFTLSADPGMLLDLDTMQFVSRQQSGGRGGTLVIRSSADDFTDDLFSQLIENENLTIPDIVDLAAIDPLDEVEFRLYFFDNGSNTGLVSRLEIDNLTVFGEQIVASQQVVPEPTALAIWSLLAVMALAYPALRLRRK